jgi:hypothetical protein
VVSMLPSGTPVRGFKPGRNRRIFSGGREVKPVKVKSQICGMLKNPVITRKLGHRQNLLAISRPTFPPFATRSARIVGDVEASGGESGNV